MQAYEDLVRSKGPASNESLWWIQPRPHVSLDTWWWEALSYGWSRRSEDLLPSKCRLRLTSHRPCDIESDQHLHCHAHRLLICTPSSCQVSREDEVTEERRRFVNKYIYLSIKMIRTCQTVKLSIKWWKDTCPVRNIHIFTMSTWMSYRCEREVQRRIDRFDPANATIWEECIKNSEPMDTSEPLEPSFIWMNQRSSPGMNQQSVPSFSFTMEDHHPPGISPFQNRPFQNIQPTHPQASFWTNPKSGHSPWKYPRNP